ncbi:MAG: CAP domain-containing protein [Luteolibacter sp.]
MKTPTSILTALFFGVASIPSQAQEVETPAIDPVMVTASTAGETNALLGAINQHRTDLGLSALTVDNELSAKAEAAFPEVINEPGIIDVAALRKEFSAADVRALRGTVTHRRVSSGAEFPRYWAQDPRWNALISGDFTHMGAATAKRSDGKLIAYVYLVKR